MLPFEIIDFKMILQRFSEDLAYLLVEMERYKNVKKLKYYSIISAIV